MTVTCTIEARLGSSRLPGKALYCLGGAPMISFPIRAALQSGVVDRVILCTTKQPLDDLLVQVGRDMNIGCFRGDEHDVARRVAAAVSSGSDANVFLTGDNPFVTPDLIADVVGQFARSNADYICTTHMKYSDWWNVEPPLPTGLSVQVARTEYFLEAERTTPAEDTIRQHSTMVMYHKPRPDRRLVAYEPAADLKALLHGAKLSRFTVDTPTDYAAVAKIMAGSHLQSLEDVLKQGPFLAS